MRVKCTKEKWIACAASAICTGVITHLIYNLQGLDFADLYNKTYGYIGLKDYNLLFVTLLKWILPQLTMVLFWGNYLENNFIENAEMILTRTKNVRRYVVRFSMELFIAVMVMCAIYDMIIFIISCFSFGFPAVSARAWINMLIFFLYLYGVVLSVNLLSIFMKAAYGVFAVMGMQIFFLEIVKLIYGGLLDRNLYGLIPVSHVLFYLNENMFLIDQAYSVFYLISLIVIIIGFTIVVLKRREVL